MWLLSKLEEELEILTTSLGLHPPLCVYGDNAYPETDFCVRATQRALNNPQLRRLNNHMKVLFP